MYTLYNAVNDKLTFETGFLTRPLGKAYCQCYSDTDQKLTTTTVAADPAFWAESGWPSSKVIKAVPLEATRFPSV